MACCLTPIEHYGGEPSHVHVDTLPRSWADLWVSKPLREAFSCSCAITILLNLTPRRAGLDAPLSVNLPLSQIHSMKEQLRLFWEKADRKEAEQFLAVWRRDAMNSGIKALKRVGKTLAAYRTGLFNYFDHRITSGAVEGLINKIKTLKRQAYGFRNAEYFKLRLYHLHTQRYSLTG